MRRISLSLCLATLICSGAGAAPYAWIPGSTADSPKTGNRAAVVDLSAEIVIGPADGFTFVADREGHDPFLPAFSPDGAFAYIATGGDANTDDPDGYIYVFNTAQAIDALRAGATALSPIQTITIPAQGEDAVEPSSLVFPPAGGRLYYTDASYERLYGFNVAADGTLAPAFTITNTGNRPSPLWVTNDGTVGYYCTQPRDEGGGTFSTPEVKAVNLVATIPGIVASIPVPLAPQGEPEGIPGVYTVSTVPAVTCVFRQMASSPYTAQQPSAVLHADDSELLVFAGYAGFLARVQAIGTSDFHLSDPFRIYRVETATNQLLDGGSFARQVDPASDQVTFPPLIHPWETGSGNFDHVAGSTIFPPQEQEQRILPPAETHLLFYGQVPTADGDLLAGSVAGLQITASLGGGIGFGLASDESYIVRYNIPEAGEGEGPITPDTVATVNRPLVVPVGSVAGKMVFGAADANFLLDIPVEDGQGLPAEFNTRLVFLEPGGLAPRFLDLGFAAGGYAQQPLGGAQPTPTITATPTVTPTATPGPVESVVVNALLGTESATLALDRNQDGRLDAADIGPGTPS